MGLKDVLLEYAGILSHLWITLDRMLVYYILMIAVGTQYTHCVPVLLNINEVVAS